MNKIIQWVALGVAVIALIVAVVGGNSQPIELGGGTRMINGMSIGTYTSPTAGRLLVGDNGSQIAEMKATTCTTILGANTSQAASTTAPYDCAVTGIASGDVVFAQIATSSPLIIWSGLTRPFSLVGAKASTTAGYVTLMWQNNIGAASVLSAQANGTIASTTNIFYIDN